LVVRLDRASSEGQYLSEIPAPQGVMISWDILDLVPFGQIGL
jgi:hypothetical protein